MLKLLIIIHNTRIFINNKFQMIWRTRLCQKKIVLAYSGGLDTSVAIAWLKNKDYDVIACCIDVGEGKDLEAIKEKGLQVGAWKSVVIDAKRDFAEQFVLPALQAHAMYEQSTH